MTTEDQAGLHQPISDMQLKQLVVEWVQYDTIRPNKYNPNRMSSQDRALLRQSLLEDGWTQPIVTLLDRTIVDGEQRWTTAGLVMHTSDIQTIIDKMQQRREEGYTISDSILNRLYESKRRLQEIEDTGRTGRLCDLTGGMVPITRVDFKDDAHKMISTIRHNRARGSHSLDVMAEIAQDLVQLGLDFDDMETRLGMDDEEINRLLQQADLPDQIAEALGTEPSQAWRPVHLQDLNDDQAAALELARSRQASEDAKAYQMEQLARQNQIKQEKKAAIQQAEAEGKTLTLIDKADLEKKIAASIPTPEKPKPPELRRFAFFITVPEYEMCEAVLGTDNPVQAFLELCRDAFRLKFSQEPPA